MPEHRARLGQRAGHVVVVADPGHRPPGERPERLRMVSTSARRLQRVRAVGQHVDDRHRRDRGHALDHLVAEDPGGEHGVVAGHDPGDVLDGLAGVEAHLLAPRVDGMAAELEDRDLHRLAGAVRRLLEDQRRAPARQRAAQVGDGQLGAGPARPRSVRGVRSVTSRKWRGEPLVVALMPAPPSRWPPPRRSRRR